MERMTWRKGGRLLRSGLLGFAVGATVNNLLTFLLSYALNLGYYAPCIAALPERFGGELNAALAQMLCVSLAGMGAGIARALKRSLAAQPALGRLCAGLVLAAAVLPLLLLLCDLLISYR